MKDANLSIEAHTPTTASQPFTEGTSAINNMHAEEMGLLDYFIISINGTTYTFNAPSDSILYNENALIYFQNEATTKFGWLHFKNQNPWLAGLIELFDPATDTYLLLFEKHNTQYPVTITEYDITGEFISGHYSGIYTDAQDKPVYDICCSFRVRRNK